MFQYDEKHETGNPRNGRKNINIITARLGREYERANCAHVRMRHSYLMN